MMKRYAPSARFVYARHFPMPAENRLALAPIVQGKPLRGGCPTLDNGTPCKCIPGMAAWGSGGQPPSSQGTTPGDIRTTDNPLPQSY